VQESHRGEHLEVAGCLGELALFNQPLRGGADAEKMLREIGVGDLGSVNANALIGAAEVRRGVEAGAQSGGGEDRGEGRGGRAFAIGSSDQNGREGAVRIAQRGKKRTDLLQRELSPGLAGLRGQFWRHCGEMIDGGLVRHTDVQYRRRVKLRYQDQGSGIRGDTYQRYIDRRSVR